MDVPINNAKSAIAWYCDPSSSCYDKLPVPSQKVVVALVFGAVLAIRGGPKDFAFGSGAEP